MNSDYMVEVNSVDKTFRTRHVLQRDEDTGRRYLYRTKVVQAAKDVNFGVRRGEVFGLLGPNGAGKTTTVKMISGLVRPSSGAVYIDGLHVEKKRLKTLRKVGVVLEGTRTSIWPLTPWENLMYYGNLKDVRGKVLKKRAAELLDFIGLKEKSHVQVRKLSRGQKQKLAICIALIADPPVILLDEPTTGLDVQSGRSIKDKIVEMTREHAKSVLVTTHDMHVAQELCDRIGIIDNGELVTCKPTAELISVFSDFTFVFHLDKAPNIARLESLPGVTSVQAETEGDGPALIARVSPDSEERSESIYAIVERLRADGYQLKSINQRKQNLENVFLELTANGKHQGER